MVVKSKVYTPEVNAQIAARYLADPSSISLMAVELGVGRRSIISKLSHMGIYVKPKYLTKQGVPPVPKSAYIETISLELGIPVEILESLNKVTKQALVLMAERIVELSQ